MSVVVSLHFATMSCNSWLLRIRFVAQLLICIAEMAAMVQEAQKAAAAAAQAREEEERQKTEAAARIAEEQAASQRQAEQKQAQDRAELEVHAFSLYSAWTFIACMVFCQSMILAGFPDLLHARWQGVAGKICRCPVRSEFLCHMPCYTMFKLLSSCCNSKHVSSRCLKTAFVHQYACFSSCFSSWSQGCETMYAAE